ncbi:MAG TPA: bifunctional demethylmenaquinone methyltransferase/2-methoxy-6-polyprenyl-1,4-benzoquinol methylase UbiE [Opitutaceae bacterium]|nr:bifunctional demethylmenaquinone methyltransferase/2-methoxy-6-polyprenyl-1,4-benzoquinol methylase UbiE [Opitutaceae bacterium]
MPDPVAVNKMFARIARRYDLANRLLSVGIDRRWRHHLVAAVRGLRPRDVLDLATGSGDVAFALSRALPAGTRVTGMDFCQPMLDEAERKKTPRDTAVVFRQGDALALPLPDASIDAITIAFGLSNLADRGRALREMRRVLRPGGALFVLEFSQPAAWFRPLYFFYMHRLAPWLAGWLTGDRAAYEYLCTSIEQFPDRDALTDEILSSGFAQVKARSYTFGVVALHEAAVSCGN